MLKELVDLAQLDGAVTHLTRQRYGNVGSASAPVALEPPPLGKMLDGDLVLLAGSRAAWRSAPPAALARP